MIKFLNKLFGGKPWSYSLEKRRFIPPTEEDWKEILEQTKEENKDNETGTVSEGYEQLNLPGIL